MLWAKSCASIFLAVLFSVVTASARWVTENYPLLPGWNGIWVSKDCTHIDNGELPANQTQAAEAWPWNPVGGTLPFSTSPAVRLANDVAWQVGRRGKPAESTLT